MGKLTEHDVSSTNEDDVEIVVATDMDRPLRTIIGTIVHNSFKTTYLSIRMSFRGSMDPLLEGPESLRSNPWSSDPRRSDPRRSEGLRDEKGEVDMVVER